MTNKTFWREVEDLAIAYANEKNATKKEQLLEKLFDKMNGYKQSCITNAVKNAESYGLSIPEEDFESRFNQYLWEAVESFQPDGQTTFRNIIITRFRLAEVHTFRQYRCVGNDTDKDRLTYEKARWDSLDRTISNGSDDDNKTLGEVYIGEDLSAEDEVLIDMEVEEILKAFIKENERYGRVIRYLYLGYKGEDLAIATGESDKYDAKVRKLVQRSKQAFKKFMENRIA